MLKKEYQFLNRLADVNNNTGIKFLHKAASPGSHCPMHMALATIGNIVGVSSLVVGMAECGYYSRFVARSPYGKNGELHYVYELDKNEVVFGCRQGVTNALLQMGKEGAKTIVIILTCVPALIGEDMESIIEELKMETDTTIVFIDGAHFKRNGYQSGFSNTFEQLLCAMEKRPSVSVKRVNIFGAARGKEVTLLKNILKNSGYELNEYLQKFNVEELHHGLYGSLTLVFNPKMLKGAKFLWERYGIPYISFGTAYTPSEILECYEEINKIISFSEDGYKELISGYKELLKVIREVRPSLADMTYIATPPELHTLQIGTLLYEVGMIPILLHVEEFDEYSVHYRDYLVQKGQNPYITYITHTDKIVDVFENELPQVSLGNCNGLEESNVIPNMKLLSIQSCCGFERSLELLNVIYHCTSHREEE